MSTTAYLHVGIDGTAAEQGKRVVNRSLDEIIVKSNQTNSAIAKLENYLERLRARLFMVGGTAVAFYSVGQAIRSVVESLKYLGEMEQSHLGIASSFMALGQYVDTLTGKTIQGASALKLAQSEASQVMDTLKAKNLETIATLDQLVRAYQEALPVALARGFDKKQVQEFTVATVQAAGALKVPLDMLGEELRSLLTGAISMRNSRVAVALGITPEDIRKLQGDSKALFEFLMGKLAAFKVAGKESMNTWAGLTSNLKDITMQAKGDLFAGAFEKAKEAVKQLIDGIMKIDEKTGAIKFNPEWEDTVKNLKPVISDLASTGIQGIKLLAETFVFLAKNIQEVKMVIELLLVIGIARFFGNLATTIDRNTTSYVQLTSQILRGNLVMLEGNGIIRNTITATLQKAEANMQKANSENLAAQATLGAAVAERDLALAARDSHVAFGQRILVGQSRVANANEIAAANIRLAMTEEQVAMATKASAAAQATATAAQKAHIVALGNATLASRTFTVATQVLGGVINALGGPIGVAIIAFGLLIMKLDQAKRKQDEFVESMNKTWNSSVTSRLEKEIEDKKRILYEQDMQKKSPEQRKQVIEDEIKAMVEGRKREINAAQKEMETLKEKWKAPGKGGLDNAPITSEDFRKKLEIMNRINAAQIDIYKGPAKIREALALDERIKYKANDVKKEEDSGWKDASLNQLNAYHEAWEKYSKAFDSTDLARIKAANDQKLAELKGQQDQGLITQQDYLQKSLSLEVGVLDKEINLVKERIKTKQARVTELFNAIPTEGIEAQTKYYSEMADVQQETKNLIELENRRKLLAIETNNALLKSMIDLNKGYLDAQKQLAELNGKYEDAARIQVKIEENSPERKMLTLLAKTNKEAAEYLKVLQTIDQRNIKTGTQKDITNAASIKLQELAQKESELSLREKNLDVSKGDAALQRLSLYEQERIQLELQRDAIDRTSDVGKLAWSQMQTQIEGVNSKIVDQKLIIKEQLGTAYEGMLEGLKKYNYDLKSTFEQVRDIGTNVFRNLEDDITEFVATGKVSFKGLIDTFISELARLTIAQPITSTLSSLFMGLLGNFRGSYGSGGIGEGGLNQTLDYDLMGPLTGSGRAEGGRLQRGFSYWVGEGGIPEMFTPYADGYLTPAKDMQTNSTTLQLSVPVTVNTSGDVNKNIAAFKAEMEEVVEQVVRRHF